MAADTPDPEVVWKAIEAYLQRAYDGTTTPAAVRNRLDQLRAAPAEALFNSPVFERDVKENPSRYSLRLGNSFYPHMKLSIDRRPDQRGFLFRADTHDRHIAPPPGSNEYGAFRELMEKNQRLAQEIEAAWAQAGLMTFKTYLKEDLARRVASSNDRSPHNPGR